MVAKRVGLGGVSVSPSTSQSTDVTVTGDDTLKAGV